MSITPLEKLVFQIQDAGVAWIEANLEATQLEEDKKPYLSSLTNALANPDKAQSETALNREAMGSEQYRRYIKSMCLAKAEAQRKRVRYDGLQMLFDARRSELALERAKIEKGIYHQGG